MVLTLSSQFRISDFGFPYTLDSFIRVGEWGRLAFGSQRCTEGLAPASEQSAEGSASPLCMRMNRIWPAKIDYFAVTVNCSSFIFTTVMSEVTLHQPCLGMMWIDLQNSVDKYFGNFPPFF